jgi:rhombotail lipoprotein
MQSQTRHARLAIVAIAAALLTACGGASRRSASLVDYLYPRDKDVAVTPSIPVLSLPLKLGIAFVPSADGHTSAPEADRQLLLNEIAEHFRKQTFVKSILVIPSAYLVPQGGFDNLDQIRKMLDVDVVALVSYDQAQFTHTSRTSFIYWTIIGAYLVEGERNDTRTLLDAALFDIASRRMLFRAPGMSHVKGAAAPVDVEKELRRDGEQGFRVAAKDLVENLGRELDAFKQKVREQPAEVKIVERPEYKARAGGGGGAGAADPMLITIAFMIALTAAWYSARRRR